MFNTEVEKQMIPKKAKEDQEIESHGVYDAKSSGMAKLKLNKHSQAEAIKCIWTLF